METADWTNQGTSIERQMEHKKSYQSPSIVSAGDYSNHFEAKRRKANQLKPEFADGNVSLSVCDGQNGVVKIRYMAPCMRI
jgi:hypothetical protein